MAKLLRDPISRPAVLTAVRLLRAAEHELGPLATFCHSLLAHAKANGLDWAVLDLFIVQLPLLQETEEDCFLRLQERLTRPHPIYLYLMVKRPSDGLYLARRTESKDLDLISGSVKRSESIGTAARRILHAEADLDASLTDVIGIKLVEGQEGIVVQVIAVLTVTDEVVGSKAKRGWRWVHFSMLLDPWLYPMLRYL